MKWSTRGKKVHLFPGYVGAAGSAAFLDELIALGFTKFIVCGGAGVLRKDIAVGHPGHPNIRGTG